MPKTAFRWVATNPPLAKTARSKLRFWGTGATLLLLLLLLLGGQVRIHVFA
jgi:hypothetical protein